MAYLGYKQKALRKYKEEQERVKKWSEEQKAKAPKDNRSAEEQYQAELDEMKKAYIKAGLWDKETKEMYAEAKKRGYKRARRT